MIEIESPSKIQDQVQENCDHFQAQPSPQNLKLNDYFAKIEELATNLVISINENKKELQIYRSELMSLEHENTQGNQKLSREIMGQVESLSKQLKTNNFNEERAKAKIIKQLDQVQGTHIFNFNETQQFEKSVFQLEVQCGIQQ